jgi:membrane protease YdiL (CAAX protease family)
VLRAPWRGGLWLGLQLALAFAVAALAGVLRLEPPGDLAGGAAVYLLLCVASVAAGWSMLAAVERVDDPLATLGLALRPNVPREVLQGLLVGAGAIFVVWLLLLVSGALEVSRASASFPSTSKILLTLLFAATFEEILFRGYLLQLIADATRPWVAVVVTSVLFGMAHNSNPGATALSAVNTTLAGVMLAVALLRTRSLWLPSVAHFAWNATMGVILGLPVSGLALSDRWLASDLEAGVVPAWWSGGGYGPEGGLVLTVVVAPLSLWLAFSRWLRPARGVRLLWQQRRGDAVPAQSEESTST